MLNIDCIIYNLDYILIKSSFIQSAESQLSSLAGVLSADMEKANELLNSADGNIPIQIHQDLASTYQELEPSFTAVSQICAEKSHSLLQAMEAGKVRVVISTILLQYNVPTVPSALLNVF